MREFVSSVEAYDIEKTFTYCTDDITFVHPFVALLKEKKRLGFTMSGLVNTVYKQTRKGIE